MSRAAALEPRKRRLGFVKKLDGSGATGELVGVWTACGPEVELHTRTADGTATRMLSHDDASCLHHWLDASPRSIHTIGELQQRVSAWLARDPELTVFRVERSLYHEASHMHSLHRTLAGAQKRAAEHLAQLDPEHETVQIIVDAIEE